MNEEKEDPILAAPTLVKEESTLMDAHDGDTTSNNVDSTSDDKEKNRLKYDQRRISLLNNPNYGVILCFLDKFRSHVDLQDYPLHLLEENLLSDEENISRRLIDFHITLLKRIALGKGAQRDKFVPVITKFAYRFDYDDGEYLKANGYSQAEIDIKVRILKNLLETQFDYNQGFKAALIEKQAFDVRSQPFGRDRSGASYWLFLDNECFIRLFRETIDDERNWTNVAKDNDELESIIRLLITDYVVRKKFPDWKFTHEPLNSLEQSHEFEQRYAVKFVNVKTESELEIKPSSPSLLSPAEPIKNKCNSIIKSKKSLSKALIKNEVQSHGESSNSLDKNGERSRVVSSEDTNPMELAREINNNQEDKELKSPTKKSRGRRKSSNWNKKKRRTMSNTSKKDEPEPEIQTSKTPMKGRKRKQLVVDANEIEDTKRKEETSQDKDTTQILLDDELNINEDLPIALRRSRRARKVPINELPSSASSPTKSVSHIPTKKKLMNEKLKSTSQTTVKVSSKSKRHRKRGRRRGNGKSSVNGCSSSDEDNQPSEEEEDEYDTDDYLPDKTQIDELNDNDLLEQEEEDDDEFVPRRSAKTVAKRHVQMNENNIEASSSSCCVCSKTDRPESLLLCDDCDDAYHLECLQPILLAVPDGDWYCPLCEHKRLCDNLVEKLIQLIKEHEELEIKRTQCMSKRSNRLANVMLNLDRMVKRSSKKRRPNGIVYSDEENEDEDNKSENEEEDENNDDDDDDDSVYGFKDDGSIDDAEKQKIRRDTEEMNSSDRLGVRSCRRKPQNYRFDDYDKKMKEAMIEAGVNGDEIDKDSDESDKGDKTTSTKKRGAYNKDDDFDISDRKKDDDEFAPDPNRSDDSATEEEEEEEDYDEDDTSDDDDGWKSKRRSSPKKKSKSKSNRNSRKSKKKSDDDESLSETELNHFQTMDTTKSDTMNDDDLNETNDDRRRSTRTAAQKRYSKQQDDDNSEEDDDEDLFENGRPPPRRMRYKKRHGSDDSFVDDDDDYEKLARKRKIVKYGKSISRSSITDHIKKLVDEESQPSEEKVSASASQDGTKEEINDTPKQQNKVPSTDYEEPQQSDDDDFPDEQEIFKANGLLKLQNNLSGPKPAAFRPPFMAPTHSYQHAIVDPTARFAMIRPSVRPATNIVYSSNGIANNLGESQQPSDSNPVNGHISPSWR